MANGDIAPPFLTSAINGSVQLHAPAASTPGEQPPLPFWIGGWVGPRASLDAVEKRKILPCREKNPECPIAGITQNLLEFITTIYFDSPTLHE
jgi:hypothetical protein